MALLIAGFICALVLAAIAIGWIAYCMFFKERPRSESHQYNISDLQRRNYLMSQEDDNAEKTMKAGIIFVPSRHPQTDDYEKRLDYPESPAPITVSTYRLLEDIDTVETAEHYKDGIYEVDRGAPATPQHSDV